jgi:hypothetical protein
VLGDVPLNFRCVIGMVSHAPLMQLLPVHTQRPFRAIESTSLHFLTGTATTHFKLICCYTSLS